MAPQQPAGSFRRTVSVRAGALRDAAVRRSRVMPTCLSAARACLLILLLVPWPAEAAELTKISFLPQWIPQAQFAGYFMAKEKGFYRASGLDVEILRGGPASPAFAALESRGTTFCNDWLLTGIQKRAAGATVVNVAQMFRHSAMMLIARKESGIRSLTDLNHKRIGLWEGDFRIPPMALFRRFNLTLTIVPLYSTINLFLKGGVDVVSAMKYNEYNTMIQSGIDPDELTTFDLRDFGLDFPEDGLYCLEETYNRDPHVVEHFVSASIAGWLYAFDHEKETLDVVMRYADEAHTGTNRAHQRWMLARVRELILGNGDKTKVGVLKRGDYLRAAEALRDQGLIREIPPFDRFYRGPQ